MRRVRTLRRRLTLGVLMAALVPVCIFAFVSQFRLKSSLDNNMYSQVYSNLRSSGRSLDMVLDKYDTVLYDMCTDDILAADIKAILDGQDDLGVKSSLSYKLSRVCSRTSGTAGITLLLDNGEILFYDRLNSSSSRSTWASQVRVPEFEGEKLYQGNTVPVTANNRSVYLFQIGMRITDYRNGHKELGTAVISIEQEQVENAITPGGDGSVYLLDQGTVISSPDTDDIGKKFDSVKNTDANHYASVINEESGFTICHEQPLEEYRHTMWGQVAFLFAIAVMSCVVMMFLIFQLTKPYLSAVDSLVDAMNKVEEGDFTASVEVPESMPREIRKIGVGFNEMVLHIDSLLGQVKTASAEQRAAELSALEAQIDPHFLYNTLDTINWKAIENEQYDISELVGALADILRYTVKNAGGMTTLRQEMGWLDHYILLQSAKLGMPLIVEKNVSEEIMGYKIHKLLLQPFLENAMKHGFPGKIGKYKIYITVRLSCGQMHFIIEDNGKGIPREMLLRLNDENFQPDGHVGIINVRRRLKLYYGDEATVYFESSLGSYTKVHLFIPEKGDIKCEL